MSNPNRKQTDDLIDLATTVVSDSDEDGGTVENERRCDTRHPYHDLVALVLLNPSGGHSKPMIVRACDISSGGIRVVTRHMIHPGSHGLLQLVRSDGKVAFVGVRITNCHYAGNMKHHTGMQFTPIPHELSPKSFVDDEGKLVLLRHALHGDQKNQDQPPSSSVSNEDV